MAKFTIRVELHGVQHSSETYHHLHDRMAQGGWRRTFRGETEFLPPAEYEGDGPLDAQLVANAVEKIAGTVPGVGAVSVLVTKTQDASDVAYAGVFERATPVFHRRSGVAGLTECRIKVDLGLIKPDHLDALQEKRSRGGRLCTLCKW
jgi:hypothetical protein